MYIFVNYYELYNVLDFLAVVVNTQVHPTLLCS